MLVSFQGQDKAVTGGSKVLRKKILPPKGRVEIFLPNPKGMTLKPQKGAAIPSPLRNGTSVRLGAKG